MRARLSRTLMPSPIRLGRMSESHEPQHAPGSHYQPGLGVVLIILVLFLGATYFILRSPSHASPGGTSTTLVATTTSGPVQKQTIVAKSKVRVQVANGTRVAGLARTYTQQLLTLGWDTLSELNGPAEKMTWSSSSVPTSPPRVSQICGGSSTSRRCSAARKTSTAMGRNSSSGRLRWRRIPRSTWARLRTPNLRAISISSAISTP